MEAKTWTSIRFKIQWFRDYRGIHEWIDGCVDDNKPSVFKTVEDGKKALASARRRDKRRIYAHEMRLIKEVRTFEVID